MYSVFVERRVPAGGRVAILSAFPGGRELIGALRTKLYFAQVGQRDQARVCAFGDRCCCQEQAPQAQPLSPFTDDCVPASKLFGARLQTFTFTCLATAATFLA